MAIAIISDIHGNVDALQTVLSDIDGRGITTMVCLGDMIGYGPNPRECLDLVMQRCVWALMGNHDFAVMYEPTSFNTSAETAAFWTRQELEREPDTEARNRRWQFLGSLKVRHRFENAQWLHASPRRPINEYIFPDDVVTAPAKMAQIFDRVDRHCFVGHTHVPGVFTDEPDFYPPDELGGVYTLNDREKCIVNPGSVGQPRDRDPRASYVILEGDQVQFIRIAYDVQAVIDKIKAIPELSDFLGLRLLDGR
ncbi:MAG: metallophosphoesterase family protein [Phycisphaeraceae bacterium]|nr:metallophosphoesterase family protein [Phycisphaeraceae bacterium]